MITINACGEDRRTNEQDQHGQTTPSVSSIDENKNSSKKNPTDISNNVSEQKAQTKTNLSQPVYSFYGDWEINRLVAVPPVAADPEKDSKKLIGKKITYSADLASFGDKVLNNPKYKITTELKQSFESGNRISFDSIGYKGDSIVMVLVYAEVHEWDSPGGYFYVKNNDILILPSDGGFFEMVRTN